jgi:hypothetical protein
MSNRFHKLPLVLLLSGLLTACTSELDQTGSWIDYSPCETPCWMGITPGATTVDEAANILEDDLQAKDVEVINFPGNLGGGIIWSLPDELGGGGDADFKDDTIIWLRTGDRTCLPEIMGEYGDPSHVVIALSSAEADSETVPISALLVWLSQGFEIYTDRATDARKQIDSSMCSSAIVFFAPVDELGEAAYGIPESAAPWHGYDSFEGYYDSMR